MDDFPTIRRAAVEIFIDAGTPSEEAEFDADDRMAFLESTYSPADLEAVEVELAGLTPEEFDTVCTDIRVNDEGTIFGEGDNQVTISALAGKLLDTLFGEGE